MSFFPFRRKNASPSKNSHPSNPARDLLTDLDEPEQASLPPPVLTNSPLAPSSSRPGSSTPQINSTPASPTRAKLETNGLEEDPAARFGMTTSPATLDSNQHLSPSSMRTGTASPRASISSPSASAIFERNVDPGTASVGRPAQHSPQTSMSSTHSQKSGPASRTMDESIPSVLDASVRVLHDDVDPNQVEIVSMSRSSSLAGGSNPWSSAGPSNPPTRPLNGTLSENSALHVPQPVRQGTSVTSAENASSTPEHSPSTVSRRLSFVSYRDLVEADAHEQYSHLDNFLKEPPSASGEINYSPTLSSNSMRQTAEPESMDKMLSYPRSIDSDSRSPEEVRYTLNQVIEKTAPADSMLESNPWA